MKKMKILSIIPARGGSKGIKKKNLVRINKQPLLYYSIKSSLLSKKINKTVVSTDNKEIADYAKKMGVEIIKRPKKLSSDRAQLEPVIEHVLSVLNKNEKYIPNLIILLQNTSPLRRSSDIDGAIRLLISKKFDSVLSGFVSHRLFWKKEKKIVRPMNYNPKERPRRQEMSKQFIENGAIFITKSSFFKKNKCRISGKIGMFTMPEELSIEIDNEFELALAETILKRKK